MYYTVTSTSTSRADSMAVEPGLVQEFSGVLCYPAFLTSQLPSYNFVGSAGIISIDSTPGSLSADSAAVSENASVEALIGARRVA